MQQNNKILSYPVPADVQVMQSQEDASINWIENKDIGVLESRYVRRQQDYFVVYLSSQTGCRQACRMCHLTATGQTKSRDATGDEILESADRVLNWYAKNTENAKVVHYNFMARGEPLNNVHLCNDAEYIMSGLAQKARELGLLPRYLISTILPKSFEDLSLCDVFPVHHPDIYYSIYSMDPDFRKKWLPLAMDPNLALDKLVEWQRHTSKIPKIHYAFIAGENDSEQDIIDICEAIKARDLRVNLNIVRYNPADDKRGVESCESIIERNLKIFKEYMPQARMKVHPRVGFDVKASCGMFVNAREAD